MEFIEFLVGYFAASLIAIYSSRRVPFLLDTPCLSLEFGGGRGFFMIFVEQLVGMQACGRDRLAWMGRRK